MSDALLICGVGAATFVATLSSRWAGLLVVALAVVVMAPIWGLSGGNINIPAAFVFPAVVGFAAGRLAKRTLERA